MRPNASTLRSQSKKQPRALAANMTPSLDAWRSQSLREAATVRRALRGAQTNGSSVTTLPPTMRALERGLVGELLLTRRFQDLNPELATKAFELAAACHAHVTTLTGVAAFELDLVASGIGAILRRASARAADLPAA